MAYADTPNTSKFPLQLIKCEIRGIWSRLPRTRPWPIRAQLTKHLRHVPSTWANLANGDKSFFSQLKINRQSCIVLPSKSLHLQRRTGTEYCIFWAACRHIAVLNSILHRSVFLHDVLIAIFILLLFYTGRYCGNTVPETIVSSESRMWLEYRSSSDVLSAFAAQYEGILQD